MTTTDGEIICRSLEQPAAFAEVYDRHERIVFRYAARRLGASLAEDIASRQTAEPADGTSRRRLRIRSGSSRCSAAHSMATASFYTAAASMGLTPFPGQVVGWSGCQRELAASVL